MEFELIRFGELNFYGATPEKSETGRVISINRTCNSPFELALNPVINEGGFTGGGLLLRETCIDLLFGHSDQAKRLKKRWGACATTHLTMTSSNTKTLKINNKSWTPDDSDDNEVDMFEELLKLQEILPRNSIEFNLSVSGSLNNDKKIDFNGKGLKLKRDEGGSASLELTEMILAKEISWKSWRARMCTYVGMFSLNVRLDIPAVTELYKKHFGRDTLTAEVGTAPDVVILVGGNKDKEKGIKCHKSILSEMSPVFAAMFRTDMVEAKVCTLEIVDFTEACVRAVIEFAYRRNLEELLRSSEMTVELLELVDKYQMKELTDMLLFLIWSMPCSWFSADVAIKLFFFTKSAVAGEGLTQAGEKAWMVLKWYAEKYPEKLLESRLCESPRAVMELVVLLLKCK